MTKKDAKLMTDNTLAECRALLGEVLNTFDSYSHVSRNLIELHAQIERTLITLTKENDNRYN